MLLGLTALTLGAVAGSVRGLRTRVASPPTERFAPAGGSNGSDATAAACYAPTVTEADADDAELARGVVVTALRAPLERGRRRAR